MPARPSPALARILPFAVYIGFIVLEWFVIGGPWLYAAQVAIVIGLLAWLWPTYSELHAPRAVPARDWVTALVLGVVVFFLWIHLDFPWARFGEGRGLAAEVGAGPLRLAVRILGVVVVVPVMEELFWRSFIMRWLERPEFLAVAPAEVKWRWVLAAAVLFGAEHHLWLAGIVGGLLYGALYRKSGHLWPVILAHAVTNALLELWVARTGSWQFL